MEENNAAVEGMKMVDLTVQAATDEDMVHTLGEPQQLDFVFGIGAKGITPFEYEISGKHQGETVVVPVQRDRAFDLFEHLTGTVLQMVPHNGDFFLKATITGIRRAESREIVSAMARATACGGGCGCGCSH